MTTRVIGGLVCSSHLSITDVMVTDVIIIIIIIITARRVATAHTSSFFTNVHRLHLHTVDIAFDYIIFYLSQKRYVIPGVYLSSGLFVSRNVTQNVTSGFGCNFERRLDLA